MFLVCKQTVLYLRKIKLLLGLTLRPPRLYIQFTVAELRKAVILITHSEMKPRV